MNPATSSLAAKLQAAGTAESWNLALEKFTFDLANPAFSPSSRRPDESANRRPLGWADRLRDLCNRYRDLLPDLEEALEARRGFLRSLERQNGPRFCRTTLVNSTRLLLAPAYPEGLCCDRITGLPIIPGRMLSVVSAASSTDAPADGIAILGAWPKTVPELIVEIVAPPAGPERPGKGPRPSPFLALEAGTEWEFALLAGSEIGNETAAERLGKAKNRLLEALERTGIGARTAAGYGRFLTPIRWAATEAGAARSQATKQPGAPPAPPVGGEYGNEAIFANRILKKLNPGAIDQIQGEIEKLKRRENAAWRARFIDALRGDEMRNVRKKLRERSWFPEDWLPQ